MRTEKLIMCEHNFCNSINISRRKTYTRKLMFQFKNRSASISMMILNGSNTLIFAEFPRVAAVLHSIQILQLEVWILALRII